MENDTHGYHTYQLSFASYTFNLWCGPGWGRTMKSNLYIRHCSPVFCADGYTFSAQASNGNYCTPDRWSASCSPLDTKESIELGFPSDSDPLIDGFEELRQYREGPVPRTEDGKFLDTVYPYVPVEVVRLLIEKHGGMVSGAVPRGVLPGFMPGLKTSESTSYDVMVADNEN